MDQVFVILKAFLGSDGQVLTLKQLNEGYRSMMGESIPYQKCGFKKLEDLLQRCPGVSLAKRGNDIVVNYQVSTKSAHIAEMIARQKPSKKKRPIVHYPARPKQASSWRPKTNIPPNGYNNNAQVRHIPYFQFVERNVPRNNYSPSVPSKVVVPSNSTLNTRRSSQNTGRRPTNEINQRLKTIKVQEETTEKDQSNNNDLSNMTQKLDEISKRVNNNSQSARKRISNILSEPSQERDSGNSSPTNETPRSSPTAPDFIRTGNPKDDLKSFVLLYKLGEVHTNGTAINLGGNKFYSCVVKVGDKYSYTSYPNEFATPDEAEKFCCEQALTDLIPKHKHKSRMISNEQDIINRIPPMLEKHAHGIWAWQLKDVYVNKYQELLPDDWLKTIDCSPCVHIQRMSDDHILYHCQPGDKGHYQAAESISPSSVSVPMNTLKLAEDGKLICQVTCVVSACEIWCEQVDTEERKTFADMFDRMQIYYQTHESTLKCSNIVPANFYIAKYEGDYYRVRAVKTDDKEVECFFIDTGDEMSIPKTDIFVLDKVYAFAQAQAFICRLVGLEDLYDVSMNSQHLADLCDKTVVIELADDVLCKEKYNHALPVYMSDQQTGLSINQKLIPELTMELATPTLHLDGITEVYVSNIEKNGDIYVQIRSAGYETLENLRRPIEEQIISNPPTTILQKITKENSKDKLYLMKEPRSQSWYRAKIIDWSPDERLAQVLFVDEGHTTVIRLSYETLYPLETLHDVLNNYPHQAVRTRMLLNKIPDNFVSLASGAIPKDLPILLKIAGTAEDGVPLVKLFKKSAEGGLFCINESIALESELRSHKEDKQKNKLKLSLFGSSENVPSTGYLKCPPLPETGDGRYFKVIVPVAVNPYNFFVQPSDSKAQLDELMEKLQIRYKDVQFGNLRVDQVLPGSIYASKHDDQFWYRTSVIKLINSGSSVSVFYCDFGYYQTLSVKQLVPLDEEFMQLPYQALKAKIGGVKPKHNKWTMDDCEKFKGLIQNKVLFAKLLDMEKDVLYESDLVLLLSLIDTSSDSDVHIGPELIRLGLAVED